MLRRSRFARSGVSVSIVVFLFRWAEHFLVGDFAGRGQNNDRISTMDDKLYRF
jgi:hypothetical protein